MTGERCRVVVALGGNAIAPSGTPATAAAQLRTVRSPMRAVARAIHRGHDVVLTHGNGPQIGNLLLRGDLCADLLDPLPMDWCVAQTQATLGVALATALEEELAVLGVHRPVVPLLTRVLVAENDLLASTPTKAVGSGVLETTVLAHPDVLQPPRAEWRWVRSDDGSMRRYVRSPQPLELLDEMALSALLDAGCVVIAGGGGGIPMVRDAHGGLQGVAAVIDKDLTGVLIALHTGAQRFVLLTDVPGVAVDFASPEARWLDTVTASELRALQEHGHFGEGSMGPKVEAALRFVEAGGTEARIGGLHDAADVIAGRAGTGIVA